MESKNIENNPMQRKEVPQFAALSAAGIRGTV
jgi:hypothetical protein